MNDDFKQRQIEQARLCDADMPEIRKKYPNKIIAYCNHKVLASGKTSDEVLEVLNGYELKLPFVLRPVNEREIKEFMGGPKRE